MVSTIPKSKTLHEGDKIRVKINDPSNRFTIGDTGTLLPNDSAKYDYKADLGAIAKPTPLDIISGGRNIIYFYENEIEAVKS
ncbi:hypothetical protein [Pseudodesulfovibrio pelocollis]|uniref:hypothetical protein n=1 Tax=Pseudodesulfovibrio pelocollis TaxID=3051432 RepID=UPI00255B2758|nr:hypothetical protein [Pseudodesulfovibrio sp. SB368]